MAISREFKSSNLGVHLQGLGSLKVMIRPDIPEAEFWIGNSPSCVLRGEDLGQFIAWLKEQDYKL